MQIPNNLPVSGVKAFQSTILLISRLPSLRVLLMLA